MIAAICECGLLEKWARDPESRIIYEEDSQQYSMVLKPSGLVTMAFCPSCGGQGEFAAQTALSCTCGSPQAWVDDPTMPFEFDSKFNEYYLVTLDNQSILFRYCPMCGGRLPKSKRSEFFTQPSYSDMSESKRRLASVKSLDEVIRILGPPDETFGPQTHSPQKKAIYGFRDVKQTIKYTSLSETFDLTVQETVDGQINIVVQGKPKGSD